MRFRLGPIVIYGRANFRWFYSACTGSGNNNHDLYELQPITHFTHIRKFSNMVNRDFEIESESYLAKIVLFNHLKQEKIFENGKLSSNI